MKDVTRNKWKQHWKDKKANCKKRRIDFLFTLDQFAALMENRKNFVCAYTGVKFNLSGGDANKYPQMDRVDSHGPYSPTNVVLCTALSHKWKTDFVENEQSLKGQKNGVITAVHRIKKTLANEIGMQEMMKPYKGLYKQLEDHKRQLNANKEKQDVRSLETKAKVEALVTKMYSDYASEIAGAGGQLLLSFAEYKRKIMVKTCGFTKDQLPVDLVQRKLYILDKTKPITKQNVVTTTCKLSNALDVLQRDAGLNAARLKKLGRGLAK